MKQFYCPEQQVVRIKGTPLLIQKTREGGREANIKEYKNCFITFF